MKALIRPPVVFLACGALMWLIARFFPTLVFEFAYSGIAFWLVLLPGIFLLTFGAARIVKHKTVIHPDRKSLTKASALVTTGVYRYTRNPIYLGMAIMLFAWVIFLENWLSVIGLVLFIAFITNYQIKPEEEALENIFGEEYRRYKKKTRRWI